jgi:hypothetical protein
MAGQLSVQGMKIPTGDIHGGRRGGTIQQNKLVLKLGCVSGLNAPF